MKEKIERYANGEFDDCLPRFELPKEPLSWEMEPEKLFEGSLVLHSVNGIRIRGYALTSDGNMRILTPEFFGTNVRIKFTYSSKNMTEDDRKKGKLILITNAGEFVLSFEVRIGKNTGEKGAGFHG